MGDNSLAVTHIPETPDQPRPGPAKSGTSGLLVSGWSGVLIWLGLLCAWLTFMGWQVARWRPSAEQILIGKSTLPSRAQLAVAQGVWIVSASPMALPEITGSFLGAPVSESVDMAQLTEMFAEVTFQNSENLHSGKKPASDNQITRKWLVPMVQGVTGKQNQASRTIWRVAAMPADPAHPRPGSGRIVPDTPFNRALLQGWWSSKEGKSD